MAKKRSLSVCEKRGCSVKLPSWNRQTNCLECLISYFKGGCSTIRNYWPVYTALFPLMATAIVSDNKATSDRLNYHLKYTPSKFMTNMFQKWHWQTVVTKRNKIQAQSSSWMQAPWTLAQGLCSDFLQSCDWIENHLMLIV